MTAINALVRADRLHVMTDGSVYEPDGTVVGSMSKVYILAHANAVVACRGPTYFGPALCTALNCSNLTGFDDLLSKAPTAAAQALEHGLAYLDLAVVTAAGKLLDLKRCDVVIAGWSHARGRGEIYKLDTSDPGLKLVPQGAGFLMPGDLPELVTRLHAHGWDLSDQRRDEARLLELLHHQRAVDDRLPNGIRCRTVGGFAQHTVITADGISTRIVERWPDRVQAVA